MTLDFGYDFPCFLRVVPAMHQANVDGGYKGEGLKVVSAVLG
jgi:hypothetical protein